jgi:hypothetical protein
MWSADGKELLFVGTGGSTMSARINQSSGAFRPEAPVQLGFQLSAANPGWAVGKDGKQFLVSSPLDRGAQTLITVVTNWEAALKRN